MDLEKLRTRLNKDVRLLFVDGETVDAILLGIDWFRDHDLTYEIRAIVRKATPPTRGTAVGRSCIARIDELASWTDAPT
jgi:hypothetical protein